MTLQEAFRKALADIRFVERVRNLAGHSSDNRLKNSSVETVLGVLSSLGYEAKYQKKEAFFHTLIKLVIMR